MEAQIFISISNEKYIDFDIGSTLYPNWNLNQSFIPLYLSIYYLLFCRINFSESVDSSKHSKCVYFNSWLILWLRYIVVRTFGRMSNAYRGFSQRRIRWYKRIRTIRIRPCSTTVSQIGRASTRYLKSDHLVDFSTEKKRLRKDESRECSLRFLRAGTIN